MAPSVGLIVSLVMTTALALPLAGLFFFRIYENQLIHQTESELIGQSAAIAAVMRRELEARTPANIPLGAEVSTPRTDPAEPYAPIMPTLDLTADDMLGQSPMRGPPQRRPMPLSSRSARASRPTSSKSSRSRSPAFGCSTPKAS